MTGGLRVVPGPWLLRSPSPDLATHRALRGSLPFPTLDELLAVVERTAVCAAAGARPSRSRPSSGPRHR